MTEINICGYGIRVDYWSYPVHGYFTKNEKVKRLIKELRISIGNLSTPRINFDKKWTPTYKIIVKWDGIDYEVWDLILYLEQLKNIRWKQKDRYKPEIEIYYKGADNLRNNITTVIESLRYYREDYGDEEPKYFKTETVVEKWD